MSYTPPAGQQPAYEELPPRIVTVNQLVAFNITYWRQMKGLTQEELGTMLETFTGRPWSKATVSAAERSWDGKRIRQFDADELVALCEALEVPIAGLLLPPTDDGVEFKYGIVSVGQPGYEAYSVRDFLNFLVSDVDPEESGTIAEFAVRLDSAIRFHYGDDYAADRPGRKLDTTDEERIRLRRADLRAQRDALRSVMGEVEREYVELGERLPGTRQDKPLGEQRNEAMDDLVRKIEEAVRRSDEAVLLNDLLHLAYEVPDECDRHAAGKLMEKLLTELGRVESSGHQSTIEEIVRLVSETAERAADYRTPWYRLTNYARDRLAAGVDREFAERMAERIRAGEAPTTVAVAVGLEPWSLRQKISMAQIKLPGVEWPKAPWEQES